MDDFMKNLVKIAVEEHKGDADGIADAFDTYLLAARQVCKIKAEMNDEIENHRAKMKRLGNELAEARKSCPCPSAALSYEGDPSGNNDSCYVCRICGKTH